MHCATHLSDTVARRLECFYGSAVPYLAYDVYFFPSACIAPSLRQFPTGHRHIRCRGKGGNSHLGQQQHRLHPVCRFCGMVYWHEAQQRGQGSSSQGTVSTASKHCKASRFTEALCKCGIICIGHWLARQCSHCTHLTVTFSSFTLWKLAQRQVRPFGGRRTCMLLSLTEHHSYRYNDQ